MIDESVISSLVILFIYGWCDGGKTSIGNERVDLELNRESDRYQHV